MMRQALFSRAPRGSLAVSAGPCARVMWELYADVKCQGCRQPSIIVTAVASVWTQCRRHILFPILIILNSHCSFSLLSLCASPLVLRTDFSARIHLITWCVLPVNVNRVYNLFPQILVANYPTQAPPKL